MNSNNLIYVIITTIIVVIVSVVYIKQIKNGDDSENFCSCRNMTKKICPSPQELVNLYNSNKLTEYTDLAKIQSLDPTWKQVMPDDVYEQQVRDGTQYYNPILL